MDLNRITLGYWSKPGAAFAAIYVNGLPLPEGSRVYLRQAEGVPDFKIMFSGPEAGITEETVLHALRVLSPRGLNWDALMEVAKNRTATPNRAPIDRASFYMNNRRGLPGQAGVAPAVEKNGGDRSSVPAHSAEPRSIPTQADFDSLDPDIRSHPIPEMTTILVDHREPGEMVRLLRQITNLKVEVAELKVGDYMIEGKLAVERKTPTDFVNSVIGERRLFHQVGDLVRSGLKPFVLLEGDPYQQDRLDINAVIGMISYLTLKGAFVLHSKSMAHTACFIAKLVRLHVYGLGYPDPAATAVAPQDPREASIYLLSAVPGVSGVLAQRLVEHFGSVRGVAMATKKELTGVHGIGPGTADKIQMTLWGRQEAK